MTESLWKAWPTVAGRVGGIVAQIQDRETGYLVDSVEECAEATIAVLDPVEARAMALRGKEFVRRFLTRGSCALAGALQRALRQRRRAVSELVTALRSG